MPESDHGTSSRMVLAGRYELGGALGRGGMATVFRAWDSKLHREVAVKVFDAADASAEDTGRRMREMHLLAATNHPHLVTLFDAEWPGRTDGQPAGFLVMELVEGESLRRRIDQAGADAVLARRVITELAGALSYLHERGIVHRDLKPENVLVEGATGRLKLVDFGIAQLVGDEGITADGTVLGTAAYLSPEQVGAHPVGPATDVYALGLVAIEALTGHRCFPGGSVESAVARLVRDPRLPDGLPAQWRSLLAGMTARDPDDRPTAEEVAAQAAALPELFEAPGAAAAGSALAAALTQATAVMDPDATVLMAVPGGSPPTSRALVTDPTVPLGAAAFDTVAIAADEQLGRSAATSQVETSRRRRRREEVVAAATVAVLVIAAAVAFALQTGQRSDSTPDPSHSASPVPTITEVVQQPAATQTALPAAPSGGVVGGQTGTQGVTTGTGAGGGAGTGGANGHGNGHGNGNGHGAPHGKG